MSETRALLTPAEVCQTLHISRTTFWRLTKNGELPALRIGGQVRVDPEELEQFIYDDDPEETA